jgi:hypothetical protein
MVQLLARRCARRPLPPGPAPRQPDICSGAWVRAGQVPVLVFEPRALADYLAHLETSV